MPLDDLFALPDIPGFQGGNTGFSQAQQIEQGPSLDSFLPSVSPSQERMRDIIEAFSNSNPSAKFVQVPTKSKFSQFVGKKQVRKADLLKQLQQELALEQVAAHRQQLQIQQQSAPFREQAGLQEILLDLAKQEQDIRRKRAQSENEILKGQSTLQLMQKRATEMQENLAQTVDVLDRTETRKQKRELEQTKRELNEAASKAFRDLTKELKKENSELAATFIENQKDILPYMVGAEPKEANEFARDAAEALLAADEIEALDKKADKFGEENRALIVANALVMAERESGDITSIERVALRKGLERVFALREAEGKPITQEFVRLLVKEWVKRKNSGSSIFN